jgi:hypothetical protein
MLKTNDPLVLGSTGEIRLYIGWHVQIINTLNLLTDSLHIWAILTNKTQIWGRQSQITRFLDLPTDSLCEQNLAGYITCQVLL